MQALTKDVRRTGGSPQLVLDPFAISWGATDVAASLGFTPEKATEIVRWVDQNSDGRVDPKELRVAMKKVQAQPGFVDPFPAGPEGPEKDLILVFASEQLKKLAPEPAEEDLQAAAKLQDALSEKYKLVQGLKERQEKAEAVLNEVGSPESKGPVQAATDFFLPQAEREKRARIRSAEETQKIVASVEEVIEYMDKINPQSSKKSGTNLQPMSPPEMLAKASEPDAAKSAAAAAKAAADKATSASAPAAEAAARAAESAKLAAEQIARAYGPAGASDQAAAAAARVSAKNAADQAKEAAKEAVEFAADEAEAAVEATAAEMAVGDWALKPR